MDTTILIVIVLGAGWTLCTYALAGLVVRAVSRRAEREQGRHETAEQAHIERERELLQLILFLARRSGEPQAWSSPPMEEAMGAALEEAARVRRDAEQLQPYGPDFDVQMER